MLIANGKFYYIFIIINTHREIKTILFYFLTLHSIFALGFVSSGLPKLFYYIDNKIYDKT